jgi:diadenosine tetraphosphate (Ap4A) HIT family hydrolase
MNDCPFCAILEHQAPAVVVSENSDCMAFVPLRPAVYGHLLVAPRHHAEKLWHLPTYLAFAAIGEVQRLASLARERLGATGVNVVQSNGADASQSVPHVHFHIVPRRLGDDLGPTWPFGLSDPEDYDDFSRERMAVEWRTEREPAR